MKKIVILAITIPDSLVGTGAKLLTEVETVWETWGKIINNLPSCDTHSDRGSLDMIIMIFLAENHNEYLPPKPNGLHNASGPKLRSILGFVRRQTR